MVDIFYTYISQSNSHFTVDSVSFKYKKITKIIKNHRFYPSFQEYFSPILTTIQRNHFFLDSLPVLTLFSARNCQLFHMDLLIHIWKMNDFQGNFFNQMFTDFFWNCSYLKINLLQCSNNSSGAILYVDSYYSNRTSICSILINCTVV